MIRELKLPDNNTKNRTKKAKIFPKSYDFDLTSSNDIEVLGENIDELPFPLVPPLWAKHSGDLAERSDPINSLPLRRHLGRRNRRRAFYLLPQGSRGQRQAHGAPEANAAATEAVSGEGKRSRVEIESEHGGAHGGRFLSPSFSSFGGSWKVAERENKFRNSFYIWGEFL